MKQTLKRQQLKTKLKVLTAVIAGIAILVGLFVVPQTVRNVFNIGDKEEAIASPDITTVTTASDGAIECASIVQGVRDSNLPDGNYTFRVNGKTTSGTEETKDYAVELINYTLDMHYSLAEGQTTTTYSLGDDTTDYKMLVVKYHGNLTIDSGVTLTAKNVNNYTYKKGMYICVMGELVNNGTISMTARGTYNQAGENVYLWQNMNNTFEYVPAVGGAGGAARYYRWTSYSSSDYSIGGAAGTAGINRATGGGGSGGLGARRYDYSSGTRYSGAGAAGTSYSGGSGGGGINTNYNGTLSAGNAAANGGAGGNGLSYRGSTSWATRSGGGGAGNLGGVGQYTSGKAGSANSSYSGKNGTGGLLMLYANNLSNYGTISSNGSNGGSATSGGGSSGGGSINIFAGKINYKGTITANGGSAVGSIAGGAGGIGSITVDAIKPSLNLQEKDIYLQIGDNYSVDKNKISYVADGIMPTNFTVGNLQFAMEDSSIASVNTSGRITGLKIGKTKLIITDTTNNLSTKVNVEVLNGSKMDIWTGVDFTVALKRNGTVWTYGINTNGELGNGNNEQCNTPQQVVGLTSIQSISAGNSHSLALTRSGEVYAWGLNSSGQLGNGTTINANTPQKVEGLRNITCVSAYQDMSIAIDSDGKIYVWGSGYTSLPMQKITNEKMYQASGTLVLSKKGYVYDISDLANKIEGLFDIVKISKGKEHNLALDAKGTAFSWGKNVYGELNQSAAATITTPKEIGYNVANISAGNYTTMILKNNNQLYVAGLNTSGQLGVGTKANVTTLTKLAIDEGTKIDMLSAGFGVNSAFSDRDGFVWHAGTNMRGDHGNGTMTESPKHKINSSVVYKLNKEKFYMDVGDRQTVVISLENTFNLIQDVIDNEQSHFTLTPESADNISISGRDITALQYGVTNVTISNVNHPLTKGIQVITAMEMESIVQGFRDANFADGEYVVFVKEQVYTVELINYYDDMYYKLGSGQTSRIVELGDSSIDYKTLVVKYHGDLHIDKGVTLTAATYNNLTYKKGMYICVLGNIYNNGAISMTARGTYNQEGEDVYLWKNIDNTYEYVPAEGGAGGAGRSYSWRSRSSTDYSIAGISGTEGKGRATGGGGSGGLSARRNDYSSGVRYSGAGSAGTSYSGGSGGGGINTNYGGTYSAGNAGANGGAGGNGFSYRGSTSWFKRSGGGGAGNTGGIGQYTSGTAGTTNASFKGQNGTGGLLMLYTNYLYNKGTISSNGSNGGTGTSGGGSSGGGSVNIFAKFVEEYGTKSVNGGVKMGQYSSSLGGAGGNGTFTINLLGSILGYKGNPMTINVNTNQRIDKSKLYYTKLNEIQTKDLLVGNLEYESLDTNIATVDSNGNVTGIKKGTTRIKVTDTTNWYETYIVVNILNDVDIAVPQIRTGDNFNVALKANGTVWAYGKNANGQLGNRETTDNNEPQQVITVTGKALDNVVDIGAGNSSSIAVDKDGHVFIWGLYRRIENNASVESNNLVATRVAGLSNIVKVESYNNKYYAIDRNGVVYAFGDTYDGIIQINTDNISMKDVDGDYLLSEDGFVYTISAPTTKNPYLFNIVKISRGTDAVAFVTNEGLIKTLGQNTSGQCRQWYNHKLLNISNNSYKRRWRYAF